jgi:hypothetical protein
VELRVEVGEEVMVERVVGVAELVLEMAELLDAVVALLEEFVATFCATY